MEHSRGGTGVDCACCSGMSFRGECGDAVVRWCSGAMAGGNTVVRWCSGAEVQYSDAVAVLWFDGGITLPRKKAPAIDFMLRVEVAMCHATLRHEMWGGWAAEWCRARGA